MLQEHLGYISDEIRLEKFRAAIAKTVQPGDTAADIGCGFGILGLLCLKAGSAHVWGIDKTDAIEVARATFKQAGLGEHYTCIGDVSSRVDLPQQVDLVVCDHVGYFGFDYGIIELLGDARRRFLNPSGRVMPQRIRLMIAGVQSSKCRGKLKAWTAAQIPREYRWLRAWEINAKQQHMFDVPDFRTAPGELGTIDLRQENPEHFSFSISLKATTSGLLDGLAGWFECELADDVWMTNSPFSAERINREQVFLGFDEPMEVASGDVLEANIAFRHGEHLIAWGLTNPRTGNSEKRSNWNSAPLSNLRKDRPGNRVPALNRMGRARKILLGYVDGQTPIKDIELAVLRDHPDLFPTHAEIRRFIRSELEWSAR